MKRLLILVENYISQLTSKFQQLIYIILIFHVFTSFSMIYCFSNSVFFVGRLSFSFHISLSQALFAADKNRKTKIQQQKQSKIETFKLDLQQYLKCFGNKVCCFSSVLCSTFPVSGQISLMMISMFGFGANHQQTVANHLEHAS